MDETLADSIAPKEWIGDKIFFTTNVRCVTAFKKSTPLEVNCFKWDASPSDVKVTILIISHAAICGGTLF